MNRRRVLNSVHRSIARKQGVNAVAWFNAQSFHQSAEDVPLERLSIKQLDQAGPKLVASQPAPEVCAYCSRPIVSAADHITCHINAQGDR